MHKYPEEFIRDIPKTDLHLHLDGSIRLNTLIDAAKRNKIELPSYTEEGLKELVFKNNYKNLGEYLHGFMYTCAVLRDPEVLEQAAYELAVDNQNEGVFYIEPRFAPQLFMDNKGITMERVFSAVNNGLKKAQEEFNSKDEVVTGEMPPFHYGIIACAMRMFGKSNFSPYYTDLYQVHQYTKPIEVIKLGALELARGIVHTRDEAGIPIVALDIAGQEDGYPAGNFREAYDFVHRNFMRKTVHAGEAYGAESIFQAITDLHADRLGHCFYLFDENRIGSNIEDKAAYIEGLAEFISDSRMTVEVCLTSNLQTIPALGTIERHTFKKMLDKRISVTLCTDNRLISNTTVTNEVMLALNHFEITPQMLKNMIMYGFKRSFFPGSYLEKRKYSIAVSAYYKKMVSKHGLVYYKDSGLDMQKIRLSMIRRSISQIKRWNVELILLGLILIPIWMFIFWLNDNNRASLYEVIIQKSLIGIVAGVLGLGIWILGVSVIMINLLREILERLDRIAPPKTTDIEQTSKDNE